MVAAKQAVTVTVTVRDEDDLPQALGVQPPEVLAKMTSKEKR